MPNPKIEKDDIKDDFNISYTPEEIEEREKKGTFRIEFWKTSN